MLGGIKLATRRAIAHYRQVLPLKVLHQAAAFFEDAYANTGEFYFEHNGERQVMRKLRDANFHTVFDAGAEFGGWTMDAAAEWPHCHVHAFEVAPLNYKKLQENVLSSMFRDRVTLNCFGLSDADSTSRMYFYPNHPELTCDTRYDDSAVAFDAQLRAGDGYASALEIETIDFLKIDVEGAEYRVLKGLGRMLSSGSIQCIQFEYGTYALRTRVLLRDFYSLLAKMYWIGKIYPTYVDFKDYNWTSEDFHFANYCCISRSREDLRCLLSTA